MKVQRIYLAGALGSLTPKNEKWILEYLRTERMYTLESYWYHKGIIGAFKRWEGFKILLDSGAYSWDQAITKQGKELTEDEEKRYLDSYINFIKKYEDRLWGYFNLDFVGDPEKTSRTQEYMEKAGLHPIPVFHYHPKQGDLEVKKEHLEYLKRMVKKYDYIALGGGVSGGLTSYKYITRFGDYVFDTILGIKKEIKVHGFGITSVPVMMRYPWYSVDSTSWLKLAAYGGIFVPKYNFKKKIYQYDVVPHRIIVSELSKYRSGAIGAHFKISFSEEEKNLILDHLESMGLDLKKMEESYSERQRANTLFYEKLVKEVNKEDKNFRKTSDRTFF